VEEGGVKTERVKLLRITRGKGGTVWPQCGGPSPTRIVREKSQSKSENCSHARKMVYWLARKPSRVLKRRETGGEGRGKEVCEEEKTGVSIKKIESEGDGFSPVLLKKRGKIR